MQKHNTQRLSSGCFWRPFVSILWVLFSIVWVSSFRWTPFVCGLVFCLRLVYPSIFISIEVVLMKKIFPKTSLRATSMRTYKWGKREKTEEIVFHTLKPRKRLPSHYITGWRPLLMITQCHSVLGSKKKHHEFPMADLVDPPVSIPPPTWPGKIIHPRSFFFFFYEKQMNNFIDGMKYLIHPH